MSEKVLVTGGAGFIGSHVVDRLVADGYSVVVVDNLSTGFRDNLSKKAKFYELDICDHEGIKRVFDQEKPDYVNHHAAQIDVRKAVKDPLFDAQVNIIGSIGIIAHSIRMKVKKIIYISTGGAVYGEPEYLPVDEKHQIKPISPYGISKHTVEHYLFLYGYNYNLNYTVLRYPNVYGPRQDPRGEAGVIAIFTEKMLRGEQPVIFGSGKQTRDYLYIEDVVNANILALSKGKGNIYNLGTGIETNVLDIYNDLKKLIGFGKEPTFAAERTGEIKRISLDTSRAKKELGWSPKNTFAEGLKKTVAYYRCERKEQ